MADQSNRLRNPTRAAGTKNSLVSNINRRKKAGISRSKADSTVSEKAYEQMRKGWPKSGGGRSSTKRTAR